jgi:lysophospholipase L1-like esterase
MLHSYPNTYGRVVPRLTPILALCLASVLLVGCSSDGNPEAAGASASPSPVTAYQRYVALGDSYTAAPLVSPTDPSSMCLRSGSNYPSLLADAMVGTKLTDVSCSGASTRNMTTPQVGNGERVPPQFGALRRNTDLVTIGIGGNDGNLFGALLGRCTQLANSDPDGGPCGAMFRESGQLDPTLKQIRRNVSDVVKGVRERSPKARIVVVGYPQIVPESGTCSDLPLAAGDYPFARQVNKGLTDAVRRGAAAADADYIDLWGPSAGHDICSDEPWINGRVTSADTALAYHPLAVEQEAVADLILTDLSRPSK